MAIMSNLMEFFDGYTLTTPTTASETISTDVINFGDTATLDDLNIGAGTPIYLNIRIGTKPTTSGTPATYFRLMTHSSATVTSGTEIYRTASENLCDRAAGEYILRMALPVDVDKEDWIGLSMVTSSAEYSAGTIDAWLDLGPQSDYDTQVITSNI